MSYEIRARVVYYQIPKTFEGKFKKKDNSSASSRKKNSETEKIKKKINKRNVTD